MLKKKAQQSDFAGAYQTSSKEQEDMNVHKVFNKTFMKALKCRQSQVIKDIKD